MFSVWVVLLSIYLVFTYFIDLRAGCDDKLHVVEWAEAGKGKKAGEGKKRKFIWRR